MAVSGNTLKQLAQALAQEIGPFTAFTQTLDGGAANQVVCSALADSEAPAERYGGYYLYCHSGAAVGEQQRCTRAGFTGATGILTTAGNFSSTPQNTNTWGLYGTMPYVSQDGLTGIRECINRALRKLWVLDRIAISATTGTLSYDLGSYPWASRKRFIRLYEPASGSEAPAPSSQGWRVVADGETWTLWLDVGFATGETFSLAVERPANSRLYISGAWADQASPVAGLVLDADACLGSWNDVYQASLYECYAQLAVQAGGARKAYWRERAEEQRALLGYLKAFEIDRESVTLGEGQSDAPGTWDSVVGDHSFWSR